jgi:membrane-associated phospholipid phosphatase
MKNIIKEYSSIKKILLIMSVLLFHTSIWAFVNYYNSKLQPGEINNLSTFVDKFIPYIGWSWPVYYGGHLYIIIITSWTIWNFIRSNFLRIVLVFNIMVITGGIIQLVIPAQSPLPAHINFIHAWMHQNAANDLYVCFPSMHVALAVLPTLLLLDKLKELSTKILLISALILICISTVVLKEHYFIDMISGLATGYLFYKLFNLTGVTKTR